MRIQHLFATAILLFASCKTPNIAISEDLKANSAVMEVKGRQGFQFNQVIRYGTFNTDKVKRGWANHEELTVGINRFVARFQKASQKLSFAQSTPDGQRAVVLAVSKFKNQEIDLLDGYLSIPFKFENAFAGTVISDDNEDNPWDFVIHNPDASLPRDTDSGLARSAAGQEIFIRAIKKIEGQGKWSSFDNYGFEFLHEGKAIAAVSTLNNGRVWISKDLDPAMKLVVSSISTSLLLRHDLGEGFSN